MVELEALLPFATMGGISILSLCCALRWGQLGASHLRLRLRLRLQIGPKNRGAHEGANLGSKGINIYTGTVHF